MNVALYPLLLRIVTPLGKSPSADESLVRGQPPESSDVPYVETSLFQDLGFRYISIQNKQAHPILTYIHLYSHVKIPYQLKKSMFQIIYLCFYTWSR